MERDFTCNRRTLLAGAASMALTGLLAFPRGAQAQGAYPSKPVRIIVPFAPGGPTDVVARMVGAPLQERFGQAVVIENRGGAGGNIGAGAAAKADPDGYTLLMHSSAYMVNPGLYKTVPYDPYKDFAPITELVTSPNIFVAHPGAQLDSMRALVDQAKANPSKLNYASPGVGTTPQLAAELLKLRTGVTITHVGYPGAGPATQAVLAGTTQIACAALPTVHPHIRSGGLKALAVTSNERWHDLPDVPTMAEAGFPDFVSETALIFMAPAGTPPAVIARLVEESMAILKGAELRTRAQNAGYVVLGAGPTALAERIKREVPAFQDLISKAGIARI